MRVGGEGRGITRPARSATRAGRPGKPLAPVKRAALCGGTGGSQRRTRALRADHQTGGVRLVRIPPDNASPASAGISDPSFFSPKRCVGAQAGSYPQRLTRLRSLMARPARRCRAECGPWITARVPRQGSHPEGPRQAHAPGSGGGRSTAGTRARPGGDAHTGNQPFGSSPVSVPACSEESDVKRLRDLLKGGFLRQTV